MRTLGAILSGCLLFLSIPTLSIAQHTIAYQVTPEDADFLQHYNVIAAFDSIAVSYVFGEVSIGTALQSRRIRLDTLLNKDGALYNGSASGDQTTLGAALRTRTFLLTDTDSIIHFRRELTARNVNAITGAFTGSWRLDDGSEFLVQVIRASDGVVLAVIDSVGIGATGNYSTATPAAYGTSANDWCRTAGVTPVMRGTDVYLRVLPKRSGSSPYGMSATRSAAQLSRRALFGCYQGDTLGSSYAYHMEQRFQAILGYLSYEYATYCSLSPFDYLELKPHEMDSILHLFFVPDPLYASTQGEHRYKPADCGQAKARHATSTKASPLHHLRMTADERGVTIVNQGSPTTVRLAIYGSNGSMQYDYGHVILVQGTTALPNTRLPASGTYFVLVVDRTNNVYRAFPIVFMR